jgi:hypothetical protein
MDEKQTEVATEQIAQPTVKKNPLAGYYRQPKVYVKLPSNGKFYAKGSLDVSSNGEYAVYAMTAKDELMFKTPDALLSGQSTVEVIKSCVPSILDPWVMPSIDLDFLLVAIRVATYGSKMEVNSKCPKCDEESKYDVDLSSWIGQVGTFAYEEQIETGDLKFYVRPYTYKEMTKTQIKTLEQQKIFNIVGDEKLSDEEKIRLFNESFVKLTSLTVEIIADCVIKIVTPDGETEDKDQIKEFVMTAGKEHFDSISNHLAKMKNEIEFKAQHVQCGSCKHEFEMPITLDQSNFFAARS